MPVRARGRILFWEGASLWILSAPDGEQYPRTDFHAHHVVQITLALRGRVDFDGDGRHVVGDAICVAPDAVHAFQGDGLAAHLFIDPESRSGRDAVRELLGDAAIAPIPAPRLGDLPARLRAAYEAPAVTDDALKALGRQLVASVSGVGGSLAPRDERVERVLAWAARNLDGPVTLGAAAASVGLSAGRARHLFVEHTGIPFKTYVLWLRLARATSAFAEGRSLTEAAHAAGFSDSAHLSRTFRRMFGINAASLVVS